MAARWVGASIKRREDPKLVTGKGHFVADIQIPGTLHCAILRSPHAHALIKSIDTSQAKAHPGVHAVLVGSEVAERLNPIPVIWREKQQKNFYNPVLPTDRVRFVGEPIGIVAADSRYIAEDALDLIEVEYEPLPVVVDVEQALAPGATLLHPEWGSNIAGETHSESGDVDQVFAAADRVYQRRFRLGRHSAFPMETRGCLAQLDPVTDHLILWTSTQTPHYVRTTLAEVLRRQENTIRVIAPDVGGGFGQKEHMYPEEALVALLAMDLRTPIKWIEDRRENFISASHARQQLVDFAMAVSHDGRILGTKVAFYADQGAYLGNVGFGPAVSANSMLPQAYNYQAHRGDVYGVVTNKTVTGAYRGFGMNKSVLLMERMVDIVAHDLGIDPAEMRFKNMVKPTDFPYTTATHHTFDAGDYHASLRRVLEMIDYPNLRREQERLRTAGRYLGIGLCHYVEINGLGPSKVMHMSGFDVGAFETGVVELHPDGTAILLTGVSPHGQSHETTLAQIVADQLGLTPEQVTVMHGDTASAPYSPCGTIASRSAPNGGAAAMIAAKRLREKLLKVGAHLLEVSVEDLVLEDGRVFVRGVQGMGMTVAQIATHVWKGRNLPDDMESSLTERVVYDPPGTSYTFSSNACVIELDPETGLFTWKKYVVNHDCGTMINPMVVEGQICGGIAQGISGVTLEDLVYDENGQLLTSSFMDYLLSSAADLPEMEIVHSVTPSPYNPLGIKGMGEGGVMGGMPTIVSAIEDALRPFGVEITEFPITPNRIFEKVHRRQASSRDGH